ncbi:hypothetical protein Fcan01_25739 [Folsomia candida]|uniref:Gustatory receptor n=1 Tax=Folsomia candida TaxID=158441 RepID=A0A226D214_FOLCA|nr:hypothetical protein Fcan01_25739 [Folsomia candida]
MNPHQFETVRLFNRLFYAKPFFWSGLPITISVKGKFVYLAKSTKLSDTIIPLVLSVICLTRIGLSTWIAVRNLDSMPLGLGSLIVIGYQWFLAMHMIYLFMIVMTILGYGDMAMYCANLGYPYGVELAKAVAAHRKLSRRPSMLDYIIRILVWAGIVLPPLACTTIVLFQLDPEMLIMSFISSKYPDIYNLALWLSFGSTTGLNTFLLLARYVILVYFTMDLFRCFILLAVVITTGIQLFKNLVDFADAYFDCVKSLGRQNGMQQLKVYSHVAIIYRKQVVLSAFGAFITITFVSASFVLFFYVLIRTRSKTPIIFLLLSGFGVFVTTYVQTMVCNYGAYINDKSEDLLHKFKKGLGDVRESRKRNEMARWIKSLEPLALHVGLGEVTFFILGKARKLFVFKQMLDYSIDTILA